MEVLALLALCGIPLTFFMGTKTQEAVSPIQTRAGALDAAANQAVESTE